MSREEGNLNDIRAILGNDKAIKSYFSCRAAVKARDLVFTRHAH